MPGKNRVKTPEHSDNESVDTEKATSETVTENNTRKHLFKRSISLRRSLLRRSQKKKQRSLELSSEGSVVVPTDGRLLLPQPEDIISQSRPKIVESALWTSGADSGIEDNTTDAEMSSNNVSMQLAFSGVSHRYNP